MRPWFAIPILLAACVWPAPAQTSDPSVASYRIRLGVGDTQETTWDGAVTVSGGDLLAVRNWHPRPEDEMVGRNEWRLKSHRMTNYVFRPWEHQTRDTALDFYWTRGVVVDVAARPGTRINVRTAQGRFSFNLREVALGQSQSFLDGRAAVDRVPPSEKLTDGEYHNDFVALLGSTTGQVRLAWVGFKDGANHLITKVFDGKSWGPQQLIGEQPGDFFLVKLGRDIEGRTWAVWSNQVDSNFDLYARPLDGNRWGPVTRLTEAPQPDIFHNVTTDSDGNLWVVWQGFRQGQSDIFARHYDGDSWSPAERISSSPANDWEPVIAADSKGGVTVAWDTYDSGDYNIMMRTYRAAAWADAVPVADSKYYEAHVSLLYDSADRLWAAWNQAGMNWGKDTGFTLTKEGERLYQQRRIEVGVWDGKAWKTPATDINQALPQDVEPRYDDFPQLAGDADGRVWIFARQRIQRRRDTPSDGPLHRAAWEIWGSTLDGSRWTEPMHFPFSASRQDQRWGVVSDGKGSLFSAWPMDNRDFEDFLYTHLDVYAARLPRLERQTDPPVLLPRTQPELIFYDMASTEKADLERIRGYEIRSSGKTYKIYRGDTHRHTEFSMDGNNDGSLFQAYRYAMDAAELDYLLISEHNSNQGPDQPYINWLLQQAVDLHSVSGDFQPFYGYERSISYPDGHRNIVFATRGNPTLPISKAEFAHEQGAARLYDYLKQYDGIAISHTSATTMGSDWRDNDPDVEPLVEIFQGDRVSAEYEGAPLAAHREDLASAAGGFRPAGYVWNAWAKGYKLGVQAASDHLSTHISYACTIAEDFTRESMLDAMKRRHNYGATDNIVLDYRLKTADGEEYLQGDIVSLNGKFQLSVKVLGTTRIRQINIVKNQEFLHVRQNQPQEVSFEFVDNEKKPGEDLYYVRIEQNNGAVAWSSPIWVTTR